VIAAPPLLDGANQLTFAPPFSGTADTARGAPGTDAAPAAGAVTVAATAATGSANSAANSTAPKRPDFVRNFPPAG
jgi:hypothetical protein